MRGLIDVIIGVTVLEAALVLRGRTAGWVAAGSVANLASGLCLLLGLRLLLSGAAAWWLLPCLAGAGAAHLLDLRGRARRRG